MLGTNFVGRMAKNLAFVLAGMLISAAILAGSAAGQNALPQEVGRAGQGSAPESVADPLPGALAAVWTSCTPENVTTYSTRLHVKCTAAVGGIQYFAVATDNPANAARILSVLSTAKVAGRTLSILYDPANTSDLPPGCLSTDCRNLLAAALQ